MKDNKQMGGSGGERDLPPQEKTYQATLNLPKTDFPMKADLARREPEVVRQWQETRLYEAVLQKNAGRPKYILHDGPPYANGNIHFGHILNKTLKDIIVKCKNMSGYQAPYIPGWDCHGLPIEHQVDKDLGPKKKDLSKIEIRKACREYAQKFVDIQREEFRRLGILGDWGHPYLTLTYDYEATIAREFGRFVQNGDVYKGLRPVLWCPNCRTALAEAEVEHEEHESSSVYVRFPLCEPFDDLLPKLRGRKVSVVIWTTTPWTLPANLAIALHENYDYVVIPYQEEYFIIAKQLLDSFSKALGLDTPPEPLCRFSGRQLEKRSCTHPFLPRKSLIVLSDHVTMDTGTGCVHIAPGHGDEDHEVGLRYGLPTLTPVDHEGRFTDEAGIPDWKGLKVLGEANPKVIEKLQSTGTLVKSDVMRHMYPHCWRCKKPVIFRATEQWFISLHKHDLRAKALDAIRGVHWVPAWGRERIYGMVENRPDWCLSRQRSWGVPIIAFRCKSCRYLLLDQAIVENVANRFEKEGSDVWFAETPEILLGGNYPCPQCAKANGGRSPSVASDDSHDLPDGGHGVESGISPRLKRASGLASASEWTKEEDILDVWFDSGVSHAAVLEKRPELQSPADLYLEGSDQHRGWFHSSLLASVGTRNRAPYKTVLTHGFVVDGQGKKYSKSAKNYVPPDKVLKENGAEILRLWVAAEDYRNDIRVSPEILSRLTEAYRKIRNTCRYLLGNLYDFDPTTSSKTVAFREIDSWSLHHLQKLIQRLRTAYEEFNFHIIFHELNRYCTVDLSSFYLDILKDRLYTQAPTDPERRAAQWVLFQIASTITRLMAPILSFTAEEIWQHLPSFPGKAASIHLEDFPTPDPDLMNESLAGRWNHYLKIRDEILKALEKARQNKVIGNALEAKLFLFATDEPKSLLDEMKTSGRDLFQVSQMEWLPEPAEGMSPSEGYPTLFIGVHHADGKKCERCWMWATDVSPSAQHPTLCGRCHTVLQKMGRSL